MAESVGAVALDIVAGKNTVNDVIKKSIDDAQKTVSGGVSGIGGMLGNIGSFALKAGEVAVAGIGLAGTAVAGLGMTAVNSYAEYEQLVGGVETLFGDMSDAVIENASNAYTTAGMSANQYMTTVTSFSASLLQSVGGDTVKACEMADMAITDMSDNANKMGTSMEMIQNAYQGFAKQNYTMLDNLKLGYGGTKTEMERLLADASAISGIEYDISSYADIVSAINVIQTEMGITGTTAKEASSTIQGSISSLSGAWTNLMTGLTDPTQDLDVLIQNVIDSAGNVLENLIPRISLVLDGIVSLITQLVPEITTQIPVILAELLPALIDGAVALIQSVVSALPQIIQLVLDCLPVLIQGVQQVFEGLVTALPQLITVLVSALPTLLPILIDAVVSLISLLCANIGSIIIPLIDAVPTILFSVATALISNLPILLQALIDLAVAVIQMLPSLLAPNTTTMLWEMVEAIVVALWESLPVLLEGVVALVAEILMAVWDIIVRWVTNYIDAWKMMFDGFVTIFAPVGEWLYNNVLQPIFNYFSNLWEDIKNVFSVVGTWYLENVTIPLLNIFANAWDGLKNGAMNAWDGIKSVFSSVASFFGDIFTQAWERVKAVFSVGGKIFDGIKDGIVNAFKTIVNGIIRGINKVVEIPFNNLNNALDTLRGIDILGISPFGWLPSIAVPQLPQMAQGGVLERGQVGLLEGNGAEAVVPLEKNTGWLTRVADILDTQISRRGSFVSAPALENVRAGVSNAKLDKIIELLTAILDKDDPDTTIPVYIGNELMDEYISSKNNRKILRSGGYA